MSYGQQGGPPSQWDPWKPNSQQPWTSGSDGPTPDWAALAEASETRNKRRRLLFIGGGAVATIAIGTAVAMAVVSANGDNRASGDPTNVPASGSIPSSSATAPSFAPTSAPPPLDPKDFVSSKTKDTAPLSTETLFPGKQLTVTGSTVYKKGATSDTKKCSSAVKGSYANLLTSNGCTRLLRATYTKDGVAVTVGVAVFDTQAQATKVKTTADKQGFMQPLSGAGVKTFCDGAKCRMTTNSYGRYAYFTTTGFTNGKDVTNASTAAFKGGDDLAQFVFSQIRRRGETQASAAALAQ
ncbi:MULTISPECIES: hypothetical protein [unclassified Streptomyces]|uniref:hypothetical protein n=1 Tax=unclassified Streptomyces TaxID=2593676 RepID=UPI00225B5BF1|nr:MULTISPECIES: hypothetical protein [unclassified Streptomyces]MCX5050442.1 hypothetical protein [Streptomyces sp. NBC_00474]MCX5060819.1 hypothetical protein [Streptomyces sp. NBC_00452]MCX5248351.1 hypothetical protein [Streptomyces sp. NBC_00201]MCX5293556.1 hypothetical protein [Streptomyces sp. NBC_00183]